MTQGGGGVMTQQGFDDTMGGKMTQQWGDDTRGGGSDDTAGV